jgi:hypothetical protein
MIIDFDLPEETVYQKETVYRCSSCQQVIANNGEVAPEIIKCKCNKVWRVVGASLSEDILERFK